MPSLSDPDDPPGDSARVSSPLAVAPFLESSDESHWVIGAAPNDSGVTTRLIDRLTHWNRSPRQASTASTSRGRRGARTPRAQEQDNTAREVRRLDRLVSLVTSTLNMSRLVEDYGGGARRSTTGARGEVPSRCLFESGQWDCRGEGCHHLSNHQIASMVGGDVGLSASSLNDARASDYGHSQWILDRP